MKQPAATIREHETEPGLERIKRLEVQLALTPVNSQEHRTLRAAIRVEAHAYRKSLDIEQASAMHDPKTTGQTRSRAARQTTER